jgi:hypothetical protein
MATKKKAAKKESPSVVVEIEREGFTLWVLGCSPIILNNLSPESARSLLLPKTKNQAAKDATPKHDPYREFETAAYYMPDKDSPTLLAAKGVWFKLAACAIALDIPDAPKMAFLKRNIFTPEEWVPLWGIPKLRMDQVKQAGQNRAPDIRTRVTIEHWCTRVTFQYNVPILRKNQVLMLAGNGIKTGGVGDWRGQKGGSSFGSGESVPESSKAFKAIQASGGRGAQMEAMSTPEPVNTWTADMLSWYDEEIQRRGQEADDAQQEE